jgi:histidyl-tRNA synthetase
MRDFLSKDLAKRRFVEDAVRECFSLYGYGEIETPVMESLDLLTAKAGDEIRHRMYAFKDLGGRTVAMRPEMTASVARVVAGELRSEAKPLRLGYIANCFRYDNPQMGRYREFWQAGFELFGSERAEADAEIILVFHDLMRKLGFRDFKVKVGNVGILRGLLEAEGIDEADQNAIMGLLDKKRIKKALDSLNALKISNGCRNVITRLIKLRGTDWMKIIASGQKILGDNSEALAALHNLEEIVRLSYEGGVTSTLLVDLGFTRGLEYYTGMIFEIFVPSLGIALGGGGRYDRLVELFGGESTSAVGCSPGIDRIVLAMEQEGLFQESMVSTAVVLVIPVDEGLIGMALKIATILRNNGISTHVEVSGRSITSALSHADRKGFPLAVIIGSRELAAGSVTVRDMRAKTQTEVPMDNVVDEVRKHYP